MARGHEPDSPRYKQTANNTKANGKDSDPKYGQGACGGHYEGQTTGNPPIAGATPVQRGRQSERERETMDLTRIPFPNDPRQTNYNHIHHQKKTKVIRPRQNCNGSDLSVPLRDVEEDGEPGCMTKVFCNEQIDHVTPDNIQRRAESVFHDVTSNTPDNIQLRAESVFDDVTSDTLDNIHPRAKSRYNDVITDTQDNVHPRAESENRFQLSESGRIWDNETQLPENQARSEELVCESRGTSGRLLQHFPLCSATVQSMCFSLRETIQDQHQKRLKTRTEDCDNCNNGFHPTIRHDWFSHQTKEGIVLQKCKDKIGLIHCQRCGDRGTCFRIGKYNIVTCYHVTRLCTDHQITAVFHCQGPDQHDRWVYKLKEEKADPELDLIIYKLLDNGKGIPPAFTKLRESTPTNWRSEYLTYIICFQTDDSTGKSRLEVHSDTVIMNSNTFDERCYDMNLAVMEKYPNNTQEGVPYGHADMHKQSGNTPLLCKVIHGGSGGVGVYLDENENPVVDFMYRRGYPGFFYETVTDTALTIEQKLQFPGCLRVEVGLDIQTLIQKSGQELWTGEE